MRSQLDRQSGMVEPTAREWALWLLDRALARSPYVFFVALIIAMPPVLPIVAFLQPPDWVWRLFMVVLGGSFIGTCIYTCIPWSGERRLRKRALRPLGGDGPR